MFKVLSFIGLAMTLATFSQSAEAMELRRPNFVVFNIKGDCGQEDCIAAMKNALKDQSSAIVSLEVSQLASHQTVDYKYVYITFKDLRTAPYGPIMQRMAGLGYNVVSYVIHDTHTGQDVILPH